MYGVLPNATKAQLADIKKAEQKAKMTMSLKDKLQLLKSITDDIEEHLDILDDLPPARIKFSIKKEQVSALLTQSKRAVNDLKAILTDNP